MLVGYPWWLSSVTYKKDDGVAIDKGDGTADEYQSNHDGNQGNVPSQLMQLWWTFIRNVPIAIE